MSQFRKNDKIRYNKFNALYFTMKKVVRLVSVALVGFFMSGPVLALETPYNKTTNKVHTALGDIPVDMNAMVGWFFSNILGFIGAIALLLMIVAAGKIITSAGNPNKIKEGQEMFASVVMGLVFILLSLFLLHFIGIDVLHIPGLQ